MYNFKTVYVHKSALKNSEKILENLNSKYQILDDNEVVKAGKNVLLLTTKKSGFVKQCPCSKDSLRCGYYNINIIEGCSFDCSYCILQLYLKDKPVTLYVNKENLFNELDILLDRKPNIRIGPGELADSLYLEDLTGYAGDLIKYFSNKNALLEIKTKDSNIETILDVEHNNQTVISFSLNPETIIETDEKGTSALKQRINAAKKAIKHGYYVAFHFDPVILIDNWQYEYYKVIDLLSENIEFRFVKWISVGLLRFPYELKQIIRENHPDSKILNGELIKTDDKKIRYFIKLRKFAYEKIIFYLKKHFTEIPVYICMDTPFVWKLLSKGEGTDEIFEDLSGLNK